MSFTYRIHRDPARDAQLLAEVEAAVRQPDLPRAMELARQHLAGGLVHPMLLNLRSYWFEQQNRNEEALRDLQQAVAIAPGDYLVRNAYGLLLAKLVRRLEAIAAFEACVQIAPDFALAHHNLGWAYEAIGELEKARRAQERAVELDPKLAGAWARLAGLAYRQGKWDEAHAFADKALELQPNELVALTARAAASLGQRKWEDAESAISQLLRTAPQPSLEHAVAYSHLGDLRHSQGRYPEAFEAYGQANAEKLQIAGDKFESDPERAYSYAAWLAEYFEQASPTQWSARRAAVPDDHGGARGHVFLVGFPRSGTTLLENVLTSNPDIVALEEKALFEEAIRKYLGRGVGRSLLAQASGVEIRHYRNLYWQRVREFDVDVSNKVFIDKHPLNSMKLSLVAKLFSGAKVLFAVRDPRDVVLSCYRRMFAINAATYEFLTLERTAKFYDVVMKLSETYRRVLELDWYELRHERLIEDFEAEASRVCEFIGVEWSSGMRDFAEHAKQRYIATPSSIQVMRGLNREGVGQWRNYRAQLEPVMPILEPWVRKFGYSAE